jgi:hypothetical protein
VASAFNENNNNQFQVASYWPNALFAAGLTASMAVNALVTGMIVFRILKVTVKPTVERTLSSTRGNRFRHIMFVIIESGMALFAIQLVRVVLEFSIQSISVLTVPVPVVQDLYLYAASDFVVFTNQMLNVIIIKSVHFNLFRFADNIFLTRGSHQR